MPRLAHRAPAAHRNGVTEVLGTNVLVRHLTGDPPDQASRATAFLGTAQPRQLLLFDVHLAAWQLPPAQSQQWIPTPTASWPGS